MLCNNTQQMITNFYTNPVTKANKKTVLVAIQDTNVW